MKTKLFSLALLLFPALLLAQTYTVQLQGQIIANSPTIPVSNVTVRIYPDSNANPGFLPFTVLSDSIGRVNTSVTLTTAGLLKIDIINCNGQPSHPFLFPVNQGLPILSFAFVNNCIPSTSNCVAGFTASPDTLLPISGQYNFISTSTNVSPTTSFFWDFGDGNFGWGPAVTHAYLNSGIYTVLHVVFDHNGCQDSAIQTLNVISSGPPAGCHAFFVAAPSAAPSAPALISFNNASIANANTRFQWTFGDGTSSTLVSPFHTYQNNGTYVVTLTQTDTVFNCTDTYIDTVFVGQPVGVCSVSFISRADTIDPNVVAFISQPVVAGGVIQYSWDFGNGWLVHQDNPVIYLPNGVYPVCLTITTTRGCTATFCDTIIVNGSQSPCLASFNYQPAASGLPLTIDFFNSSPWQPGQLPFDSVIWDFGDGSPLVVQNSTPTHTYASPGSYNVCITVVNAQCTNTFCAVINVGIAPLQIYRIDGIVFGVPPIPSNTLNVVLYELQSSTWIPVDSMIAGVTIPFFQYEFDSLAAGIYSIRTELTPNSLNYLNYFPTYLGNTSNWNQAQGLIVGPQNPAPFTTIIMIPNFNLGSGGGLITGNVINGSGLRVSSRYDGMRVQLLSELAEPLITTVLDAQGNFSFNNLPFGKYLVHIDWPGMPCNPYLVELSATQPQHNGVQFTIGASGITTGLSTERSFENTLVFPNPVSDWLNLTTTVRRSGTYTAIVRDLSGRTVMVNEHQLESGAQELQWSFEALAKGMYFLEFKGPDQRTETFRIIR